MKIHIVERLPPHRDVGFYDVPAIPSVGHRLVLSDEDPIWEVLGIDWELAGDAQRAEWQLKHNVRNITVWVKEH